jgi:hypothetical protein
VVKKVHWSTVMYKREEIFLLTYVFRFWWMHLLKKMYLHIKTIAFHFEMYINDIISAFGFYTFIEYICICIHSPTHFVFFIYQKRKNPSVRGVFTTICYTYIHPRKKNILCVCEDQFQRLSVSLRRWMIIKTDNTSTCFIDCLMSRRRKRSVEGGDIYLRWHFQYIYIYSFSRWSSLNTQE